MADLKDIRDHCLDLAAFFKKLAESGFSHDWLRVARWLSLASSIKSVHFDPERFQASDYGWTSDSDSYYDEIDGATSSFVNELTIFNYIWLAMDTFVDIISLDDPPNFRGKINSACWYLKINFDRSLIIPEYIKQVDRLCSEIMNIDYYRPVSKQFKLMPHVSLSGFGLYIVSKIRNKFAYAVMSMPDGIDDGDYRLPEVKLLNGSSRIVLLTMQMLIIGLFKNNQLKLESEPSRRGYTRGMIDVEAFMFRVHSLPEKTENKQGSFFNRGNAFSGAAGSGRTGHRDSNRVNPEFARRMRKVFNG